MNMQQIMAQAQKMQRDIEKNKKEIEESTFSGESEWVSVEFSGSRKLKKINIKYEGTITSDDKDVLEDMLNIAISDALSKIDAEYNKKMGSYGSSLNGLF